MKSVVQEWMNDLTFKQQTVVLSALRGCDGLPKDDAAKKITRFLRGCVLHNAGTENTAFMRPEPNKDDVNAMLRDMDKYPVHYILHLMHAAEIIGFYHPHPTIWWFWRDLYHRFADAMHLNPETKIENEFRLRDGVDSD